MRYPGSGVHSRHQTGGGTQPGHASLAACKQRNSAGQGRLTRAVVALAAGNANGALGDRRQHLLCRREHRSGAHTEGSGLGAWWHSLEWRSASECKHMLAGLAGWVACSKPVTSASQHPPVERTEAIKPSQVQPLAANCAPTHRSPKRAQQDM